MIVKWKKQLPDNSSEMFASGKGLAPDGELEIKALQSNISETMCTLSGCGEAGSKIRSASKRGMN